MTGCAWYTATSCADDISMVVIWMTMIIISVLKVVGSYKKDDGVLPGFSWSVLLWNYLYYIHTDCAACHVPEVWTQCGVIGSYGCIVILNVSKVIICTYLNKEVLVFIYVGLVTADPYVALSCIGSAVFMVGCCRNYQQHELPLVMLYYAASIWLFLKYYSTLP
jgi:hypothetical protein